MARRMVLRGAPRHGPGSSARASPWLAVKVRDLLLETKAYDLLVGTLTASNVERSGCLFRYLAGSAPEILRNAARVADTNGMFVDSIRLFSLAGDNDDVANLLLDRLSRLAPAPKTTYERQQLLELARDMLNEVVTMSDAKSNALAMLIAVCELFDMFAAGPPQYDGFIATLDKLKIAPINSGSTTIEWTVRRFRTLAPAITRCFGALALAYMEVLKHKHGLVSSELSHSVRPGHFSQGELSERSRILDLVRDRARALVSFVGLVQVHVSADVNAKLVTLEAKMTRSL